jgi:(4-alkanoyl-5-oxo-2,5-dihydrofuran-3-yl)methyl phosphate reductase
MPAETVLVTGGTGTVGRLVVGDLVGREGIAVRVFTRNPAAETAEGAELRHGDLEDTASLELAMRGCDRVFLISSGTRIAAQDATVIAAAERAGVQRVVKLSALGVGHGADDPISRWHRAGEAALRRSTLRWTMLRPTGFMSNALDWSYSIAQTESVYAPYPLGRTATIDPADIARVASRVLSEKTHDGMVYELTGPEALTPAEQVEILSDALGKTIHYVAEEPTVTTQRLQSYGMPDEIADAVVQLLASALNPYNARCLPTVAELTGQPATTFRSWVAAHADDFARPNSW